ACDDGPRNADDAACTTQCAIATCGDGLVQAGVEECEDGNEDAGDFCDACMFESISYAYTAAPQSVVLPPWIGAVRIEAWGARGGGSLCCDSSVQEDGGQGGYAAATFSVASGETLELFVGGQGGSEGVAGYNGGGAG